MYYIISISIDRPQYGKNGITINETTEEKYNDWKKYAAGIYNNGIIDELNYNYSTGYVSGIINTETEDFEEFKNKLIKMAVDFISNCIENSNKKIESEVNTINRLQNNPIYKAINRDIKITNIFK